MDKQFEDKKVQEIIEHDRVMKWKPDSDEFYWLMDYMKQRPEVIVQLMLTRAIRDLSKYRMGYVN